MPLSKSEFADIVRQIGPDAAQQAIEKNQIGELHAANEKGTLSQVWEALNQPLVGGEKSPFLQHTHGGDESTVRRMAEDLGSSLTSPISLATAATGLGASAAGARGLLGISKVARGAEAALQLPFVAEGVHKIADGGSVGEKFAGAIEAGLGAHGVKTAATHAFDPEAVVQAFMKERGITPQPGLNKEIDSTRSMKIADAYSAMKHEPENPQVKSSYDALGKDVQDQYNFLVNKAGVKIEPFTGEGEPYKNSAEMVKDVEKNNHLYFLPTQSVYGGDEGGVFGSVLNHPMLKPDEKGQLLNDKFRAVHDYFGHARSGNQFGPRGEEAAYIDHLETLSPKAVPALTAETRGQNSFVNFGPHMRDAEGKLIQKGQPGYLAPTVRPFAEQKAGLLPEEFTGEFSSGSRATAATKGPLSDDEMIQLALDSTAKNGGASIGRIEGSIAGTRRYPVESYPDLNQKFKQITPDILQSFIDKNRKALAEPGNLLGVWRDPDTNVFHVGVSQAPDRLKNALRVGQDLGEKAVYDTGTGRDIKVNQNLPPWLNALLGDEMGAIRTGAKAGSPMQDALPLGKVGTRQGKLGPLVGELPQQPAALSKLPVRPYPKPEALDELYQHGKEGAKWYEETGQKLQQMLGGDDAGKMIDFLAATSPNASVKANAKFAVRALEQLKGGEDFTGFMGNVIKDLKRASAGDEFGGRKVQAFAKALKGDPNAVVVDRWVMRAMGFPEGKAPNAKVYQKISDIITERATANGVSPREYQAALWLAAKKIAGRPGDTGESFENIIQGLVAQPSLFNPKGLLKKFPDAEMVLEHRSANPNLSEVDPNYYGTGLAGAEKSRAVQHNDTFEPRSYYTVKGEPFEQKFNKLSAYETDPLPKNQIYDLGKDPLRLKQSAATLAHGDPMLGATILETLVKQRGYIGYLNSSMENPQMRSAVALFEKQPVRKVS